MGLVYKVDDKYQYCCENKDNKVHGWISMNSGVGKPIGFWIITPSNEFRNGGPTKQDLTSHVGPTALSVSIQFLISYTPCLLLPDIRQTN